MTSTPLPPSDGWQLRLVYFQDGEPIMHQARADLEAENARLMEALQDIADDYADRFDLESPSTNPGIKHVIKQARTALDAIEADHFTSHDMASAAAQGFRDGVASVQQEEPVGTFWQHPRTKEWHQEPDGEPLYRAAPVAQQQEPVAHLYRDRDGALRLNQTHPPHEDSFAVYTAPVAQQTGENNGN